MQPQTHKIALGLHVFEVGRNPFSNISLSGFLEDPVFTNPNPNFLVLFRHGVRHTSILQSHRGKPEFLHLTLGTLVTLAFIGAITLASIGDPGVNWHNKFCKFCVRKFSRKEEPPPGVLENLRRAPFLTKML